MIMSRNFPKYVPSALVLPPAFWAVLEFVPDKGLNQLILSDALALVAFILPETNTWPLKNGGWETSFLLGLGLFSEAMLVSERVQATHFHRFPSKLDIYASGN